MNEGLRVKTLLTAATVAGIATTAIFIPGMEVSAQGNEQGDGQPITPEQAQAMLEQGQAETHTIAPGDTLSAIARQEGVTLSELLALNPAVSDPNNVPVGYNIIVPVSAAPQASAPIAAPAKPLPVITPMSVGTLNTPAGVIENTVSNQTGHLVTAEAALPNSTNEQPTAVRIAKAALRDGKAILSTIHAGLDDFLGNDQIPSSMLMPKPVDSGSSSLMDSSKDTTPNLASADNRIHIVARPDGTYVIDIGGTASDATVNTGQKVTDTIAPTPTTPATPSTTIAPMPPTNALPDAPEQTVPNRTEQLTPSGTYEQYLAAMTTTPEPAIVTEKKQINIGSSNALQRRSEAYDEKMAWIEENTTQYATPEAYARFAATGINSSLAAENIFAPELPQNGNASVLVDGKVPCFVIHWTAGNVDNARDAALMMLNRDRTANVQMFTMRDGVPYLITPTIDTKAYHAGSLGNVCVGTEDVGADMLDFTPGTALANINTVVYLHRQYGMPLERNVESSLGQLDKYNDYVMTYENAGTVKGHGEIPGSNKKDPTTRWVNYVYTQAVRLNALLDGQAPTTPATGDQALPAASAGVQTTTPEVIQPEVTATETHVNILDAPIVDSDLATIVGATATMQVVGEAPVTGPTTPNATSPEAPVSPTITAEQVPPQLEQLLSPAAQSFVPRDAAQALEYSRHAVMNGGDWSDEEAFGPQLEPSDWYIYYRLAGATHDEAMLFTTVTGREANWRPGAVGDIKSGQPSYGGGQIRDIGDSPIRDPQSNMDPFKAAQNVIAMYRQSGGSPWEISIPDTISPDSLFTATHLPDRDWSADKRKRFEDGLHRKVDKVIASVSTVQAQVDAYASGAGL